MEKIVKITCSGADTVDLDTLVAFQGGLKTLSENEAKKIAASIERFGFSFPVFVWRDGETNNIIDGHQRVYVLRSMIESGWKIDGGVPVVWVEAKDEREAKEKVLAAASMYARINIDGLQEFIDVSSIDIDSIIGSIDLPHIDMSLLKNLNFDPVFDEDQPRLDEKSKIVCPECGHEFTT